MVGAQELVYAIEESFRNKTKIRFHFKNGIIKDAQVVGFTPAEHKDTSNTGRLILSYQFDIELPTIVGNSEVLKIERLP